MKLRLSNTPVTIDADTLSTYNRNFELSDPLKESDSRVRLMERARSIRDYDIRFLFDYDIFPHFIMSAQGEWTLLGRRMKVGDAIIQRIFTPPIGCGVCVECAVRVYALVDEPDRIGFAYETLAGHLEKGTSEFMLIKQDGNLIFDIHTFSAPAHWLTRTALPISHLYQKWCTHQALRYVQRRFHEKNEAETGQRGRMGKNWVRI